MIEHINLSKYQEANHEEKDSRKGWMDYGSDNLFPQYLIGLYNGSAVHNALINSIAYMIYGNGIQLEGEAQLWVEKWGLNDELLKAAVDLKLQGGFYLEISWSLDRSYIKGVRHIPFEEIRAGYMDMNGEIPFYHHCLDWENYSKVGVNEIKAWGPGDKNDHPVQLVACKPFSVGSHYYPKPDYMGAINWVEVDKEIAIFHNNNIANGMAPSFAIHWKNGIPSEEKRRQIRMDMEAQLTGARNAGKFFMTFSDGGDTAPDIQVMELSDAHNQFQFLSEESTDKIMIGHRVTSPALFGVKTAGQLGTTEELQTASKLFQAGVISPYQEIMVSWVRVLLNECNVYADIRIESSNPMLPQDGASLDQSFTGIQIASAVDIISKVRLGELTAEQAAQLLISMLAFPENVAREMLMLPPKTELSSQTEIDLTDAFDYLDGVGEAISDEYELIDESDVDYDLEAILDATWNFASVPSSHPNGKSEQDTEIIKVRYVYTEAELGERGNATGTAESRPFCRKMMAAKKVYRKEDIEQASSRVVNAGFGPGGSNSYDLFLFKGGPWCRHYWKRQTYLRLNNKKISVNDAKALIRKAGVDAKRLTNNSKKVAQPPRAMDNHGYLKPR